MIEIIKYSKEKKTEWDNFVSSANNGTFLFYRNYMEYHSDRFNDFSIMLYDKGKLSALFPFNYIKNTLFSHQGLTFGGIITNYKTDSLKFIQYFNEFSKFALNNNFKDIIYKSIPQIYKSYQGDDEHYAMFRVNAELIASNLSSVIDLSLERNISRNRKRALQKSFDNNLTTNHSEGWSDFWNIMEQNMKEKFNVKPVHSLEEIIKLNRLFPNNIKLLSCNLNNKMVGGAVIYLYKNVIKVQYAHADNTGKTLGAIDNIYNFVINNFKDYKYLDLGTSNLENGNYINSGLLKQKSGFGAKGITFNIYKYSTDKTIN